MMHQIVIVRIDGQFHIGGVVAALAGIVGFPADFRAGRSFRFVMHQIVVVRVLIAVLKGCLRAVGALVADAVIYGGRSAGGFGLEQGAG